jgi:hypothetical protein
MDRLTLPPAPPPRDHSRCIYVCHSTHENDAIYAENIAEYCSGVGIDCQRLPFDADKSLLLQALDDEPDAVIGFNSQLDRAWLGERPFLSIAADRQVPVVQWILDHPSARWSEFSSSTADNSRYVFHSRYSERYFRQFCLPKSATSTVMGVGPNKRSRVADSDPHEFLRRDYPCLIPLNLARLGRSIGQLENDIVAVGPKSRDAVVEAFLLARHDLIQPIEVHACSVLNGLGISLPAREFHGFVQMLEEKVQAFRRLHVLTIARDYPVLIQSDDTARSYADGGIAFFEEGVRMGRTLSQMPQARAVVSVSHLNDMIHDRTLNGLNAGCVNIVEDSIAHRAYFQAQANALFFRYDDDSLRQCLELVCNRPRAVYHVAANGFALRDQPPFRFGGYHNFVAPRVPAGHTEGGSLRPVRRAPKEVVRISKSVKLLSPKDGCGYTLDHGAEQAE